MEGYIALHRKILEWEWYDDMNVFRLFMHCLLKANHKDKEWRGNVIKRGSFISSLGKLSQETGLTVKQVRTSLDKLKRTSEMASKGTSQHTVFTIKNYDEYQSGGKQKDKRRASEGQAKGKQRATTNNDNNENNENKDISTKLAEFDLPAEWEASALKYWAGKNRADLSPQEEFQKFQDNHISKGTKSSDWSRNWRTWYTNAIQYTKKPQGVSYAANQSGNQQGRISSMEATLRHNAEYAAQLEREIEQEALASYDQAMAVPQR